MADEKVRDAYDDGIQHGIDDNPENDPQKGAVIGGVGGAAVGAAAGSMMGPVGAVIGAVVGGAAGAVASGAAVAAIDQHDNDDTMSGMGDDVDYDEDEDETDADVGYADTTYGGTAAANDMGTRRSGVETMGMPGAGSNPTYGAVSGDVDRSTFGGPIPNTGVGTSTDYGRTSTMQDTLDDDEDLIPGNDVPGVQTGGSAIDGTPDTRGVTEKISDAVTGDHIDDKTGRRV